LKDSSDLNLSASKKLIRPQSTKNIYSSSTNLRKGTRNISPAIAILKSPRITNPDRSQEIIKSTNKSFDENVKSLEMMINEIKMRGFEKVRREVDDKQRIIKHLQLSVDSLQRKVNFVNSQKKHFGTKNSKFETDMNMYRGISERCNRDIFFMYKEMPGIKREIEEMNVEYGNRIRETKFIYTLVAEEDRNINLIKEDIRKLNKVNSDIEVIQVISKIIRKKRMSSEIALRY
jgi:hypothetical protein